MRDYKILMTLTMERNKNSPIIDAHTIFATAVRSHTSVVSLTVNRRLRMFNNRTLKRKTCTAKIVSLLIWVTVQTTVVNMARTILIGNACTVAQLLYSAALELIICANHVMMSIIALATRLLKIVAVLIVPLALSIHQPAKITKSQSILQAVESVAVRNYQMVYASMYFYQH